MADPRKKSLQKQASLSYIEQSLKIIPPPPQEAPVTIYPGPKARHATLSKADLEIADRLEKLKKRDLEPPTEEEMASRLAQLKGLPADHYTKPQTTFYKPPDNRSNVEKSDDLFKQMMEEVVLDAPLPKPEDGIEARLARLRGDVESQPSRLRGDVGQLQNPVGTSALCSAQTPRGAPFDSDEVEQLLKEAELEATGARAAVKDLAEEPEIGAALVEAARKKKVHRPRGRASRSTSSDEKRSASDEDERREKGSQKTVSAAKDAAEVERIVQLYTKKAQEKKKRRKARAKKAVKDPSAAGGSSSSSNDSCTSSDLSTSESERLSDSD